MGNIVHPSRKPSTKRLNLNNLKPVRSPANDGSPSSQWEDDVTYEVDHFKRRSPENVRRRYKKRVTTLEGKTLNSLDEISQPKSPHEKVAEWLAKNERFKKSYKTAHKKEKYELSENSVTYAFKKKLYGMPAVSKHSYHQHYPKYMKPKIPQTKPLNNSLGFKLKGLNSEEKKMLRTQKPLFEVNNIAVPEIQELFSTMEKKRSSKGDKKARHAVKKKAHNTDKPKEMPWLVQSRVIATHMKATPVEKDSPKQSVKTLKEKSLEEVKIPEVVKEDIERPVEREAPKNSEKNVCKCANKPEKSNRSTSNAKTHRQRSMKVFTDISSGSSLESDCLRTNIPPYVLYQSKPLTSMASFIGRWALTESNHNKPFRKAKPTCKDQS